MNLPVLATTKSPGIVMNHRFPMIYMVEGGGFEPPKSLTTDLQSVPFGRSGIPPGMIGTCFYFYVEPRIRIERITC